MKKLIFLIFFGLSMSVQAQDVANTDEADDTIYNTGGIDVIPEYPGGMEAFRQYLGQEYKVPKVQGLSGKIFVSFVVDKDGSLTDIKVIRDIGHDTGKEAVRVLSQSAKWSPGLKNGHPVRVLYSVPINITTK